MYKQVFKKSSLLLSALALLTTGFIASSAYADWYDASQVWYCVTECVSHCKAVGYCLLIGGGVAGPIVADMAECCWIPADPQG